MKIIDVCNVAYASTALKAPGGNNVDDKTTEYRPNGKSRKKKSAASKRNTVLEREKKKVFLGADGIYEKLKKFGVQPCFWPTSTGGKGEWKFRGLKEVRSNPWVTMHHVTYVLEHPETNKEHTFEIRYSNGAVAIVLINEEDLLFTRQHRPSIHRWCDEFPQSFTDDPGPGEDQFNELSSKKLSWLLDYADQWECEHLGHFYDDPGTRSTCTQVYFVSVRISDMGYDKALRAFHGGKEQRSRTAFQFKRYSLQRVDTALDEGKLSSLILHGALSLATRKGKISF